MIPLSLFSTNFIFMNLTCPKYSPYTPLSPHLKAKKSVKILKTGGLCAVGSFTFPSTKSNLGLSHGLVLLASLLILIPYLVIPCATLLENSSIFSPYGQMLGLELNSIGCLCISYQNPYQSPPAA